MNTAKDIIRRELRVAFSRRAQPVWFRVVKWIAIMAGVALWYDQPAFWRLLGLVAVAGFALHLFYRWKTRVWTRAWGGWDDLAAGRD